MGRRRAVTGSLAVAVLLLVVMVPAATSQERDFSIAYDPLKGPAGTVIEITGRCVYHGYSGKHVLVDLLDGSREVGHADISVNADGTFDGTLQVPADEQPGPRRLASSCFLDDMAFGADDVPFEVTAPAPATTTRVTTATTTAVPTTAVPTTAVPSTAGPTTAGPITAGPTTTSPPTRIASAPTPGSADAADRLRPTTTTLRAEQAARAGTVGTLPALVASALVAAAGLATIGRWRRRGTQPSDL